MKCSIKQSNDEPVRRSVDTDKTPVKMMMDPLSICQIEALTYTRPIPPKVVPSKSIIVGTMKTSWKTRGCFDLDCVSSESASASGV